MQSIEREGYTREEILQALHAVKNARNVRFRYDLLDKNEHFKKTLSTVTSGEVSLSAFSTIKRTAKFTIKEQYIPEHTGREGASQSKLFDSDFSQWGGSGVAPVSGALKMSTPATSLAPEWQMENFGANEAGVANGWIKWGGSHGTFSTATGVTGSAQVVNKTSTTQGSIGIQTASKNLMNVTSGDWIYLSFIYKKDSVLPPIGYLYATAADGKGHFNFSANGEAFHTDLGNGGWWRCDAKVQATRSTTVGAIIAVSTPVSGGYRIDNVYFQKNIPPVWTAEALSPVIDLSDNYNLGGSAPKLLSSTFSLAKTPGTSSSQATPPGNDLWSRYSLDGGLMWSNWALQRDGAIEGLSEGTNMSGLMVQLRWMAERFKPDDYVSLDRVELSVHYERDTLIKQSTEIDYLTDRIQPFMEVRMPDGKWIEFPLGVFILSTPTRRDEVNGVYRDIEAYDGLAILDEDKFISRHNITAGTKYTEAVRGILSSAGIKKFNIEEKDDVLKNDIEFKIGTSKLEAVNQLLDSINFTPVWVDANGYFTASRYISPVDRAEEYRYEDNEISVIYNGMEEELDLYGIPNVWVITQSNPEKEPLTSTKMNDKPGSPTSIVNLGRKVVDFREVDDISDQKTLDAYTDRIAFEASQVFGKLKFKTALMPFHEYADVYTVKYDPLKIDYKFSETAWTMKLEANGEMEHEVRRVVNV